MADEPDGNREAAKEWAYKASERFDKGDYQGAIEGIREAEKHVRAPTLSLLSAQAHDKLGKLIEAQQLYQSIIDFTLPADAPDPWKKAKKTATSEMALLNKRIPTLALSWKGHSEVPIIAVDGKRLVVPVAGNRIQLNPGLHVVVARVGADLSIRKEVRVSEGSAEQIEFDFTSAEPPLTATASQTVAPSTPTTHSLPPGPTAPTATLTSTTPSVLRTEKLVPNWLVYSTLGVGAAGLVLGGVMGGIAFAEKGALAQEDCKFDLFVCRSSAKDRIASTQIMANTSTVGFIAGGVFAAAGLVLFLLPSRAAKSPVATVVSPSGIVLLGAF
ncbi:MAG: hypothetical protein IPK82_34070 [Polyangiaceae bacterium]|nr:hypothetical protein [Polyangiaceae bacterium]